MKYYVLEHGSPDDSFPVPKTKDRWDRWTAQEAAEDYHNNHDGWEAIWPLTFVILDDGGNEKARYSVEREYDPVFYAMGICHKAPEETNV